MTSGEKEKKEVLQRQVQALRSGQQKTILDALQEIRSGSSISIVPEIIGLMHEQEDESIRGACASLLNDLKSEEAVPALAEAIENPDYRSIRPLLLSACWQNGLNYSAHIKVFVKTALEDSLECAIEAVSVLEEGLGNLEEDARKELVVLLKGGITSTQEDKVLLIRELIRSIESYQPPPPLEYRLDVD